MNETTDKIANKLLESIQKNQSTTEQSNKLTNSTRPAARSKNSQKISKAHGTKVSKVYSETQNNFESNRQFLGRLRWLD